MTHDVLFYGALFLGVMAEGEVSLLAGALAANRELANIFIVGVVGFLSTLVTDWGVFFAGRFTGHKFLSKYLKNQEQTKKVSSLLNKYPILIIFLYRYLYGLRIITLTTLGMMHFPPRKFIPLSLISIALWTLLFTTGGYYMGELISRVFTSMENYSLYFLAGIMLAGGIVFLLRYLIRKRLGNNNSLKNRANPK